MDTQSRENDPPCKTSRVTAENLFPGYQAQIVSSILSSRQKLFMRCPMGFEGPHPKHLFPGKKSWNALYRNIYSPTDLIKNFFGNNKTLNFRCSFINGNSQRLKQKLGRKRMKNITHSAAFLEK